MKKYSTIWLVLGIISIILFIQIPILGIPIGIICFVISNKYKHSNSTQPKLSHKSCPVCNKKLAISDISRAKFNGYFICNDCINKINEMRGGERSGNVYLEELQEIVKKYDENVIQSDDYNIDYKDIVPYDVYCDAYTSRKQKGIVKDYVVFDTETTGLEPSVDKIIELSAIKYVNNKKVDEFSCLVNPKRSFDPFITKLTGISPTDLIGKPTIDKVLLEFYEFIEDYTLIAHNAPYDIKMLACEAYRNNIPLCNNKIIDTVHLAKRVISKDKIENYKLETLKNYLGLKFKSHRALDDCEVCAKVYQLYLASTQKKKIIVMDEETGEILEEIN